MVKDKVIFVDSDGTIMDSMTPKHEYAFGPAFVEIFGLEEFKDVVLKEWNRLNLYSLTRGVNRFEGCYLTLKFVNDNLKKIDILDDFKDFLDHSNEKSVNAIKKYIEKTGKTSLESVIKFSERTNELIIQCKDKVKPFMNAKLGLEMLSKKYTIIIISSANYEAVKDEWTKFDILKYADEICTQEMGTKKICIAKMLQKYQPSHALMMGDALGDLDAAIQNAINFYPIKPQKEEESWKEFLDNYEKKFQTNTYVSVQNDINKEFKEFLTK